MVNWTKIVQERITKVPISAGRSAKLGKISFDDLIFLPAQLAKGQLIILKSQLAQKPLSAKTALNPLK